MIFEIGQEVQIVSDRPEIIPIFRGKIGEVTLVTSAPSMILELYYPKQRWYSILIPQTREHEEMKILLTAEFLMPVLKEDKVASTWESFEKHCGFSLRDKTQ